MRPSVLRRLAPIARPTVRPFTTTRPSRAVAAAAAAANTSAASPGGSGPTLTPKKYARTAPASTSGSASLGSSRSASKSSSAVRGPSENVASAYDDGVGLREEEDYSIPDLSAGIDDYAALTSPSPAIVRRARTANPDVSAAGAAAASQPTPSPPLTSLPSGPSTLPMAAGIGRQPDIQGELPVSASTSEMDWSTSFSGLGQAAFPPEVGQALLRPLDSADVEVKPDGLLYLPEIKYRRTLNAAFGPGGWGLAPRGETNVGPRIVSREWGLIAMGRLVSVARGEQEYFDPSGIPTATEACKSNALMRCCKDLGIASELWDPRYIREFKAKYCVEVFTEHQGTKRKKKLWRKKDAKFEYPYKES